jgi:glycerol-3-phosphate acyltransferase PlsY
MISFAIVIVGCYLLGSVPFGYLVGRIAGIDIRKFGSGNIGATNVVRVLGKRYGYSVFVLDFLKGLGAVAISAAIATRARPEWESAETYAVLGAVSAVIGHSFPPWLKFRGGKGVATSAGALFGLMPLAMVIGVTIWILVFLLTRYVSLASITAATALPFVIFIISARSKLNEKALFYSSICLAGLVIWRHRSNLSRLMHGTESRFTRK